MVLEARGQHDHQLPAQTRPAPGRADRGRGRPLSLASCPRPHPRRGARAARPSYRLPILLHYYADLSLEQVSRTLNLSVPAVKSRLHRARAQLRNSLAEAEEFEASR
ncbi:MAG: hypothetical protein E6I96_07960 [Chloroflexi bacterium]|nr:MAG: hypothetical protein E6I96_07960 [Chloroflexota bacterium]